MLKPSCSKPGAAPVSAWLGHEVIGLHKGGYGFLLGESVFTSIKVRHIPAVIRFYVSHLTLDVWALGDDVPRTPKSACRTFPDASERDGL